MSKTWHPFNINETVRVKLTQHGLGILKRDYEEFAAVYPSLGPWKAPTTDENGWSEHQLWMIMRDLGPHILMGGKQPMETGIEFKTHIS